MAPITCWDNPHKIPPVVCAANITLWNETITANFTKVRGQHVRELRDNIDAEFGRRGLDARTWVETIADDTTIVSKSHVDELRANASLLHKGDCAADTHYCPEDTSVCVDSMEAIVADVTPIRAVHFNGLRVVVDSLKTSCICEAEQCNFCSDCGYRYSYTTGGGMINCNCEDHCGVEGCGHYAPTVYHYLNDCGSVNSGLTLPFKAYPGATPQDGYVPWTMGSGPLGHSWGAYHAYWSCLCNPFTYA